MMFLSQCYFTSFGKFQRRKHRPGRILMQGHLESNQVPLLMIIALSVQNNKPHGDVQALLQPARLAVLFAENTQSKIQEDIG